MEKVRYEEMLPHEIVRRRKRVPAAFVPLGGLEWHGEHLAVGNDALKAEKLCEIAAAKSGGFAFPPLWYGEPRGWGLMETNHDADGMIKKKMGFRKGDFRPEALGAPEEQRESYQALLLHVLKQMRTLRFRAICLLAGHYPLARLAEEPVATFNKSFSDAKAFAGTEVHYVPPSKRRIEAGGDHAAKWETSYLMALRPECVDMTVYLERDEEPLTGVGGEDPRKAATREVGERGVEIITQGMVKKARELLRRAKS